MASEFQHQKTLVDWFRATYPDIIIFAIPNGGKRLASEAMKLKMEGVLRGVSDLFIPELKLFIEMKKAKGRLANCQLEFKENMEKCGYKHLTAYSYMEARKYIEDLK